MAHDISIEGWEWYSQYFNAVQSDLKSARRKLSSVSYDTLSSVKYEDANGVGSVFSVALISRISSVDGKIQVMSDKLDQYSSLLQSGIDSTIDIDERYGGKIDIKNDILPILGESGIVASVAFPAMKFTEEIIDWSFNDRSGKGLITPLKTLHKMTKSVSKWTNLSKNLTYKERNKKLFGFNVIKPSSGRRWSKAKDIKARFSKNLRKTESFGEYFDSAAPALAIGVIVNGLSNFDECSRGEISAGRAYVETLTETGVDVVKDWAIAVGVTAVLATASVTGPTVFAVGVTTMVASTTLDFVTEKITYNLIGEEKNFTEAVSDLMIDTVGGAVKTAGNVGEKIAGAVSKIKMPKMVDFLSGFA